MNCLITICARGGSKGIPGKNVKLLNGKPLIAYSIAVAHRFLRNHPGVLTLSTDDELIKEVAGNFGLETPYLRPARLATDKAGKIGAIRDVKEFEEKRLGRYFDFVIDLDVTSPLRTVEDLVSALKQLRTKEEAYNIFSVSLAKRNPYYNMVEPSNGGYVKVVKQSKK